MTIKGIITESWGHGSYALVRINNIDTIVSLNIAEVISSVGFRDYYSYESGDSIIKKSNSKEFTIKNKKGKAVYILVCDD